MSEEPIVSNPEETAIKKPIENKIYAIRNIQVILDMDIAEIYGIETKRLNEQVRRNASRFPGDFMFQLTKAEFAHLRSQNATANWSMRRSLPYAFTELGVSMLSSVLTSEVAIQANVHIMRAFAAMRRFLVLNAQVFQRLENLEYKQIAAEKKLEKLYEKMEEGIPEPSQGIFYDGQIFDAYNFVCGLIKQAKRRIILLDNYVDETVLTVLDKRSANVSATIYSKQIPRQLQLDLVRHNAQYESIDVKSFNKAHDRFLIIDDKVYHIGASLKDIGKKWFAFSLMNDLTPEDLLSRIK